MDLDGLAGGSQTMMMQREQMIEEEEEMAVDSRRLGPVAAFAPATSSVGFLFLLFQFETDEISSSIQTAAAHTRLADTESYPSRSHF